jgi:drug/metabolite transporter (DMT)-like permease
MIASVVIASFSQILLKTSAARKHESFIKEYLNVRVIAGYGMLVVSTLLTILAFRGMEYKNGPVIESAGFILVMLLSRWILKEKITLRKVLGNALIVIGIVVFYLNI